MSMKNKLTIPPPPIKEIHMPVYGTMFFMKFFDILWGKQSFYNASAYKPSVFSKWEGRY